MKIKKSPHEESLERLDIAECDDKFQIHLHEQRYRFALEEVDPGDDVLEVGTGLGVFSEKLSRKVPSYRGIEYDPETLKKAKLRVPNPESITTGDAQALEFSDDCFDTVVCLEVLEHLPDYRKALDEIARVLKPGGILIATIPYAKIGSPSRTNIHHLYEPGENEFKSEITKRYAASRFLYHRYSETTFESIARTCRLRKLVGLQDQYAGISRGDAEQMDKIEITEIRSGFLLGLAVVATSIARA